MNLIPRVLTGFTELTDGNLDVDAAKAVKGLPNNTGLLQPTVKRHCRGEATGQHKKKIVTGALANILLFGL